MIVGLVAYYQQEWQTLQLIMSSFVFGFTLLWFFIPESPRWLLSNNKFSEAESVLSNGAKFNRRPLPDGFLRYGNGPLDVSLQVCILTDGAKNFHAYF